MPKKLTQAEFLAKAVAVHGVGRYDYSQTVYLGVKNKIAIRCRAHGLFNQNPGDHLFKRAGCPLCKGAASSNRLTHSIKEFIVKAKKTHGDFYDYSTALYQGSKAKLKINCPVHGVFEQTPNDHTQGAGCPGCADNAPLTTARFIEKAQSKHGDQYDYSQVLCVSKKSIVTIWCPEHGEFNQVAGNHLMQAGCPKCSFSKVYQAQTRTTESFIAAARARHGDKYDYSQTIYARSARKVEIICPIHGVFKQVANDHVMGRGCRACAWEIAREAHRLSWIERANGRPCTLYLIRLFRQQESFYKIGVTWQSVEIRYKSKAFLNGYQYEVLAQHVSTDAVRIYEWEQSILETFSHLRYQPENSFGGETECFSSADEILAVFPL